MSVTVEVVTADVIVAPVTVSAAVGAPIDVDVTSPAPVVIDLAPTVVTADMSASTPTVTVAVAGAQGPAGGVGPAGDGGFTHTQASPAATWTITNTLGRYPAAVTVVIGDEIVDADIETPDTNTIVITFASPQSGRAEVI